VVGDELGVRRMSQLVEVSGILRYGVASYGPKLVVELDKSLAAYYLALIPKSHGARSQMYPSHISVVRKEQLITDGFWGHYEGQEVPVYYHPQIRYVPWSTEKPWTYYWLDAYSQDLERIREELGLSNHNKYNDEPPPTPFTRRFHITIANTKPR
jgi:hypothetical protein